MSLNHWLHKLQQAFYGQCRKKRRSQQRQERFSATACERLEDRTLLAATVESSLMDRVDFHFDDDMSARYGVAILNLTTGESAVLNTEANTVYGTSSTIKIGVLYSLLKKIDADSNITLDTELNVGIAYGTNQGNTLTANGDFTLRDLAKTMIANSNNWATNRLMDFIGVAQINKDFADLGLKDTHLQRYNTCDDECRMARKAATDGNPNPMPTLNATADGTTEGYILDYRAGFDNESTPSEFVLLLTQIHENNGRLSGDSYDEFWEILNLNPFPQVAAGYFVSADQDPFPNGGGPIAGTGSIIAGSGNGGWGNLLTFYTKPGSNSWSGGNVDHPNIGDHFQRSEAGRVVLDNGDVVFFAIFADEASSSTMFQTTFSSVGYEFAVEFADPFISLTPDGAELDDGRVLTVDMANFSTGNNNSGDEFKLALDGDDLVVEVNFDEVYRAVHSEVDKIRIFGSDDDDILTVDHSNGTITPMISYDGRGGFDELKIEGGDFTNVVSNYIDANSGNLDLDGQVVNYTELEPVLINVGTAANMVFNLPTAATVVHLEDDAFTNNGISQLRSGNGTFETTTFTNPTNSLTINAQSDDDTIFITALDNGYAASTTIIDDDGNDSLIADGVDISGTGGDGLRTFAIETVNISNSTFNNNIDEGIDIDDPTNVTITNTTASGNIGVGIDVFSTANDVSISDATASSNGLDGLRVTSVGHDVSISGTTANGNGEGGIGVVNAGHDVAISNTTAGDNGDLGIAVLDVGNDVSISNTTTNGNGSRGIAVLNVGNDVSLSDTTAGDNGEIGIEIQTATNIAITNTTASDNLEFGIFAANVGSHISISETVASGNDFGIVVNVGHAVSISNTTANGNNLGGVSVDTFNSATISLVTTSGNGLGLFVNNGTTLNVNDWTTQNNGATDVPGGRLLAIGTVNFTTTTDPIETFDKLAIREDRFQHFREMDEQQEVGYDSIGTINFFSEGGNDIFVLHDNVNNAANAGEINIDGGTPSAGPSAMPGDKLVLAAGGTVTFTDLDTGSGQATTTGGDDPIDFVDIEETIVPDENEYNNTLNTATVLGSPAFTLVANQSIHSTTDEDWFKITANQSGVLQITVQHMFGPGMDLELAVFDADGDLILEVNTQDDNEFAGIPVVAQKVYFIRVRGAREGGETSSCNFANYDLEIENTPVLRAPEAVDLDADSDTGMMNNDNVTADTTPTVVVSADLDDLLDPNNDGTEDIVVLTAAEAAAGDTAGVAVLVTFTHRTTGDTQSYFATRIGSSFHFEVTPPTELVDGRYFATAEFVIVDNSTPNMSDEGPSSRPLEITIDTTVPAVSVPALLTSSDTGMNEGDNVTSKMSPAFQGTAEPNAKIRILANGDIVGQGVATSDGRWEITVEPLDDGVYTIATEVEDLAGNIVSGLGNGAAEITIWVDTTQPNTPYLDLLNDTGRHSTDNVTRENVLDFTMVGNDTVNGNGNPFPNDVKYRLYWRVGGGSGEVLVYDSWAEFGDFVSLGELTRTVTTELNNSGGTPFPDGFHNFKLEIEDRAGNISHDFLNNVVIDTVAPPAPPTAIDPAFTDTGISSNPGTFSDRITSHTFTAFTGTAEADAIVRLTANGVSLGQTVATPLDGDEAFPQGTWQLSPQLDLNDSRFFLRDGIRRMAATAEDLAGNVSTPFNLDIFIDTQGPRVVDPDGIGPRHAIEIGGAPGYNLLAPILGQGPTPAVNSLIINLEDAPARVTEFLYEALDQGVASDVGHYQLVGDRSGVISIDQVVVKNLAATAGAPSRATIELRFNQPLPDDRFTLTLLDTLVDRAGNRLDGESNASSPTGSLFVRSGDANSGGNFVARFTVDSRVEIASVGQAVVQVDVNGNFVFDPSTGDLVNRDQTFNFGLSTDAVFAGEFTPEGVPSDGYDRLGAYGFVNGSYRWLFDFNNDNIVDSTTTALVAINGVPFAGNFTGHTGDEIGLFDGGTWYIDTTGDSNIGPGDVVFTGNMQGLPITGDFDGDGLTDLATYLASTDTFFFDLTSAQDANPGVVDGNFDATLNFGFGGVLERPFAGDFNLDGVSDIGLSVPTQNELSPGKSDWYVLLSNPAAHTPGTLDALANGFFPVPGQDVFTQFGSNNAVPLVGNFRAPAPQFANTLPGTGVVGADAGGGPHVRVFDNQTGQERLSFFAYNPIFTGGVRVASGDVNGDNVADIITGPGPGGGPHVRVFDGRDGSPLRDIMAFNPLFTGGVTVASADVNEDGFADIIVGAGAGGGPNVMVFSGLDGSTLMNLMAYNPAFTGGVHVAAGDVDRDGKADVIVGAGAGGGPHVVVFSGANGSIIRNFMAYNPAFTGGVHVGAGDTNGDGFADILLGAGAGGGPHVRVVSGQDGTDLQSFFAFAPGFTGGVRVAAGDVGLDNQVDILVTTGSGISPQVRVISGTGVEIGNFSAFGAGFTGGAFVAGGAMPGETLIVEGEPGQNAGATLTDAQLGSVVAAAISRYDEAGLDEQRLGQLAGLTFAISDLSGDTVGLSRGNTIYIDPNAAGRGWFVDATPDADEEFDERGLALDSPGEVDLLSVVLHELGHQLGLPELYADTDADRVMSATIRPGQRRLPASDDLDDLFASGSLFETLDLH